MTLLVGRARPVYRVYGKADYLAAGADPFADWETPSGEPAEHGRAVRRLLAGTALAGALGAVGGVLGTAFVHGRPAGHGGAMVADRAALAAPSPAPVRASPSRASRASIVSVQRRPARRPAQPGRGRTMRSAPVVQVAYVSSVAADAGGAPARTAGVADAQRGSVQAVGVPSASVQAVGVSGGQGAPVQTTGAGGVPAHTAGSQGARSEFGFER
jgi:hypothetical protein